MAQKVTLDLFLNDQGAIRTIAGLKEGIKLATEEANRLRDAGIGGFSELELSVGAANTRIKDFEKQLKGLTAEELGMAYARIGGGISSGFAAATAALQIFGVESDRVTQTAQDAQNLLTLAISTRQVAEGILSARLLANIVAQKARTLAVALDTSASKQNADAIDKETQAENKNTEADIKNATSTKAATNATKGQTEATIAQDNAQKGANQTIGLGRKALINFFKTIAANPFGALITAIGLVVTSVIALKSILDPTAETMKEFNTQQRQGQAEAMSSMRSFMSLASVINDNTRSLQDQKAAYKELQKQNSEFNKITFETIKQEGVLKTLYEKKLELLVAEAKQKAALAVYSKALEEVLKVEQSSLEDYYLTWDSLLRGLTTGNFTLGATEGFVRDLGKAYRILNVSQELVDNSTKEVNDKTIEYDNIIRGLSTDIENLGSATNAQVIRNQKLAASMKELESNLKELIKMYKELGKAIKVEDKTPEFIENTTKKIDARRKLLLKTSEDFGEIISGFGLKLQKTLMLPPNFDGEIRTLEDFTKALKPVNQILNETAFVSDVFGEKIRDEFGTVFQELILSTDAFGSNMDEITKKFVDLYQQGQISIRALQSVNALTTNFKNLNIILNATGDLTKEVYDTIEGTERFFGVDVIKEYYDALEQVVGAEGNLKTQVIETRDEQGKSIFLIKDLTVETKEYAKNLETVSKFENFVRKQTIDYYTALAKTSKDTLRQTIDDDLQKGTITLKQHETLMANLENEAALNKVIMDIADARLDAFKAQSTATRAEIDRIFDYFLQFEKLRNEGLTTTSATLAALVNKDTERFVKASGVRVKRAKDESDQINKVNEALYDKNLVLKKTEEETEEQFAENVKRIYRDLREYQEQQQKTALEKNLKSFEEYLRIIQNALNQYQELLNNQLNLDQERLTLNYNRQLERITENTRENYETRILLEEEYQAQLAAIQKKYRVRQLRLDRAQAVANGALGVTRALGQEGALGFITAGLIAAATLASVVQIQQQISFAQQMKRGGVIKGQEGLIIKGPSHENGGVSFQNGAYNLEGGESVVNRVSSRNYQGLLSQINQMGGGRPLVASFDDSRIVDAIAKQKMEPIRAYVVEQDISNQQAVNKRLEQLSRF